MTVLKPSEAMSHGRVMRIKREESKTINDQINEFFGRGGKIEQIPDGASAVSGVEFNKRINKGKKIKSKA